METSDYIIIGVGVVAAYFVYQEFFKKTSVPETTNLFNQIKNVSIDSATTSQSTYRPNEVYTTVKSGNTNYFFYQGDYDKLNFAQKFLLNIGTPASWVLQ